MHLSITGNSSEAGQPPALQSVRVNRDTGLDDTASLSQRAVWPTTVTVSSLS